MTSSRKPTAMSRNDLRGLARAFWEIVEILRGRVDVADYQRIALAILVLKWASDNPGRLVVPTQAAWEHILEYAHSSPGNVLNDALHSLASENQRALGPP